MYLNLLNEDFKKLFISFAYVSYGDILFGIMKK